MSPNLKTGVTIRASIVGATGYTGAELLRILLSHPHVSVSLLTSRSYAGKPIAGVYPAFEGVCDLVCSEMDLAAVRRESDVAFLALPHKLSMDVAPALLSGGVRVVDLSADFRFRNRAAYEAAYQPHSAPELLKTAVYGLPEVYGDRVREARLVGNPGCYPTSTLLPLAPFARKGWVDVEGIIVDAKSGVSGAGRGLSLSTHFCEAHEGFSAYKVAEHRHQPEMEEVLSDLSGKAARVTFVPHLVPMSRGMLTTSYSRLTKARSLAECRELLRTAYGECPMVRILGEGRLPQTRNVRGTNFCDIAVRLDERTRTLILVSAIDNLTRGASGQAVANMNLMFGFPENAGLDAPPMAV